VGSFPSAKQPGIDIDH